MAINTIIMIGDGMGWEMARAAAIYKQIQNGKTGATLSDFYTQGEGTGLNFQTLTGYALATTYGTTIAGSDGVYNTGNSALLAQSVTTPTGSPAVRPGFQFDPTFNPGINQNGGANANNGVTGNLVGYDPARGGVNPWTPGNDQEYIKYSYPDSANTATTLYTGVKSYNGAVGVDIFQDSLNGVLAQAALQGKSTGLVTSVPIDHATPAAAAANVNNRNKFDDNYPAIDNILQQELRTYQPTVLLGGGHPLSFPANPLPAGVEPILDNTYIKASTYTELSTKPTTNRYDYTFLERGANAAQVLADTAAQLDPEQGDRLFGLYGARGQNGNLPVSSANGDYSTTGLDMFTVNTTKGLNPDTQRPLRSGETDAQFIATERDQNPTLDDLTKAALEVLGKDPDGFWLMVEGGDIDWSAHDNNIDNLIGTVLDFDKAVGSVINWINNNGGWANNQLIVTADHDHYLNLNSDFPTLLQTKGAQALTDIDTIAESGNSWGSSATDKYNWGTHTNRPVPVYYQGAGTEILANSVGQGFESYGFNVPGIAGLVDQTHIYRTMIAAVLPEIKFGNDVTVVEASVDANAVVTVTLSQASSTVVTVNYATSGGTATSGTDFTAATGTLTFAAGQTSKTITIPVKADAIAEADEKFTITLTNPVGATIPFATSTVTITDTVTSDVTATLAAAKTNLTLTGVNNIDGTGNAANNIITGNSGNNKLTGFAGNDTLIGGVGNDTLIGGLGDDTYVVDSIGDVVTEAASQGTDLVQSSITYTLSVNVENLTLTGTANINGTGNTANNTIIGNNGDNTLNGGAGADTLIGGVGNDTYIVDNILDVVTEALNGGTDLVQSSVTYTLSTNVENLTLTGTTAINGTGNSLNNTITGNSGNNTLNGDTGNDTLIGGVGNDSLVGGIGNDTYNFVITTTSLGTDTITEAVSGGQDTIDFTGTTAAIRLNLGITTTQTLVANGSKLTLTAANAMENVIAGAGADRIIGNDLDNRLLGGAGNDTLIGGAGNDTLIGGAGNEILTGGAGNDVFGFAGNAAFTVASQGLDTIQDFGIGNDQISLSKSVFASLASVVGQGFSVASEFATVEDDDLTGISNGLIVYSSSSGSLYYNENGAAAGFGTGGEFAILATVPTLTANNFSLV